MSKIKELAGDFMKIAAEGASDVHEKLKVAVQDAEANINANKAVRQEERKRQESRNAILVALSDAITDLDAFHKSVESTERVEEETVQLIKEMTSVRDLAKKVSPRILVDVFTEQLEQLVVPERTQSSAESIAQKTMEEAELKKRVSIASHACEMALYAAKEQLKREETSVTL